MASIGAQVWMIGLTLVFSGVALLLAPTEEQKIARHERYMSGESKKKIPLFWFVTESYSPTRSTPTKTGKERRTESEEYE